MAAVTEAFPDDEIRLGLLHAGELRFQDDAAGQACDSDLKAIPRSKPTPCSFP